MTTALHELEAKVLELTAHDRVHLLERLLESFEPDTEIERAWVEEALRREADVKAGRSKMISADDALQRARGRIA